MIIPIAYSKVVIFLNLPGAELLLRCTSLAAAKSTGKNFAVVINHLHPSADAMTTLKALADLNCPVCPVVLRQRADYQSAAVEGVGVTELSPQGKAAEEVRTLWAWLEDQINA